MNLFSTGFTLGLGFERLTSRSSTVSDGMNGEKLTSKWLSLLAQVSAL
jgi:hypothetical protein